MFMHREVTPPVSGQEHASQTVIKALSFILSLTSRSHLLFCFLAYFYMLVLEDFLHCLCFLEILSNKNHQNLFQSSDIISGVSIFANPYQLQ